MKRKKLLRGAFDKTITLKDPFDILVSGFGTKTGEVLVGRVLGFNTRVVLVQLKDEDGFYLEKYTRRGGIRIQDLEDPSNGWKIDIKEIDSFIASSKGEKKEEVPLPEFKLRLLSSEEIPYDGDPREKLRIDIWEDENSKSHYLKATRTGVVEEGSKKRIKELPCVVPFKVLKHILYEYESLIDDESIIRD